MKEKKGCDRKKRGRTFWTLKAKRSCKKGGGNTGELFRATGRVCRSGGHGHTAVNWKK